MYIPTRPGLRDSSAGEGESINLTPMLDVLFLILFFFLLATQARNETPALEIQLPQTRDIQETRAALPGSLALISILKDNAIWLDTEQVAPEALADRLAALDRSKVKEALVRVDREADSATLLQAFDACQKAGLEALVEYEKKAGGPEVAPPRGAGS